MQSTNSSQASNGDAIYPRLSHLVVEGPQVVPSPVADQFARRLISAIEEFDTVMAKRPQCAAWYRRVSKSANIARKRIVPKGNENRFELKGTEGVDRRLLYQYSSELAAAATLDPIDDPECAALANDLIKQSEELVCIGVTLLSPLIEELCINDPALRSVLMPGAPIEPCSIRVTRYAPGLNDALAAHIDRTALTAVLWTTDAIDEQLLAFQCNRFSANYTKRYERLAVPAELKIGCPAIVFIGTALFAQGYWEYVPQPHMVLPNTGSQPRYSITFSWMAADLDFPGLVMSQATKLQNAPSSHSRQ